MLRRPLQFRPVYQTVVWGGDTLGKLRPGVPEGPVGEAWDLADHPRGQSVVLGDEPGVGGRTLSYLVKQHGRELVGPAHRGGPFPLMVKLIDARQRLSVQVHPDDALAAAMGLADGGKTECWWVVGSGGELFVGAQPGVDERTFEAARERGTLGQLLRRSSVGRGDFVYLPAGTVHAIGEGCLLLEVQQTSDNTFRVDDWGRVGLDGKPRPLHVEASRRALNLALRPEIRSFAGAPRGRLVDGPAFTLDEVSHAELDVSEACAVVVAVDATTVETPAGRLALPALGTALVPAAAGSARVTGLALIARPCA